jgi:DNA-directed RNA polymerase II subunit RPB1
MIDIRNFASEYLKRNKNGMAYKNLSLIIKNKKGVEMDIGVLRKFELLKVLEVMIDSQLCLRDNMVKIPFNMEDIILENVIDDEMDVDEHIIKLIQFTEFDLIKIYGQKRLKNDKFREIINERLILIKYIIWQDLSSKIISKKYGNVNLDGIFESIKYFTIRSIVQPGEFIGMEMATGIANVITQLTLDTFHLAGDGSKGKVVQNMKTLKSVLRIAKDPDIKSVYTRIYNPKYFMTDSKYTEKLVQKFRKNFIENFISNKTILSDDEFWDGKTIIKEESKDVKYFVEINESRKNIGNLSLRCKFDRKKMFARKINIEDIMVGILEENPWLYIFVINDTSMRIYINLEKYGQNVNELIIMRKLYDSIGSIQLTGVHGIEGVQFNNIKSKIFDKKTRKEEIINENILYTNGINLPEIFSIPYIDELRTISNEVREVFKCLGIEAARRVLLESLTSIIKSNSADVNYSYLHLLTDYMTHNGKLIGISAHGLNKVLNVEPLQKIGFERVKNGVIRASIDGEKDNLVSPSSNIMTCNTKRDFDILI